MLVKLLGTAAGGGFPQWNCACPNCCSLRAGTFAGKARTQTQLAISADASSSPTKAWFLLGASPDLRVQIEATPELHPHPETTSTARHSPIAGAVLLNADVDHVLGLLLLRELQPLQVYATESVRKILQQDNSMFRMLERVPGQASWTNFVPRKIFSLIDSAGKDSGLRCRALPLGQHLPPYVSESRRAGLGGDESSLGLIVEAASKKRLAYMPAVPHLREDLVREFESADVLLFDGTFWDNDELIRTQGSGQTAQQMGHVPVRQSLSQLAQLQRPRKIYVHINNTNPMLNEAGPEARQVREAGWEIAEDGWQLEL
jgi:pyrroloquinoline quinone biosynthesis protein B